MRLRLFLRPSSLWPILESAGAEKSWQLRETVWIGSAAEAKRTQLREYDKGAVQDIYDTIE